MTPEEKMVWAAAFGCCYARGARVDECSYIATSAVIEMRGRPFPTEAVCRCECASMLEEMRSGAK